jgi:hypothetical protein
VNEGLEFTKLASSLLTRLEEIGDDERLAESTHSRMMAAVLAAFSGVDDIISQRSPSEPNHQHSDQVDDQSDEVN